MHKTWSIPQARYRLYNISLNSLCWLIKFKCTLLSSWRNVDIIEVKWSLDWHSLPSVRGSQGSIQLGVLPQWEAWALHWSVGSTLPVDVMYIMWGRVAVYSTLGGFDGLLGMCIMHFSVCVSTTYSFPRVKL